MSTGRRLGILVSTKVFRKKIERQSGARYIMAAHLRGSYRDLQGYIMYAADGHMSVNLMKPGRPKFSSGDIMRSTAEERAAAAEGYFAYAGTYEIDEAKKMVVHHVEYSLYPNWVGMDQHRLVILEGNKLELRSPKPVVVSGEHRTLRVRWERTR